MVCVTGEETTVLDNFTETDFKPRIVYFSTRCVESIIWNDCHLLQIEAPHCGDADKYTPKSARLGPGVSLPQPFLAFPPTSNLEDSTQHGHFDITSVDL